MQKQKHTYYKAIRYLINHFQRNEYKPSQQEMEMLWQKICMNVDQQESVRKKRIRFRILSASIAASLIIAILFEPWTTFWQTTDIEEVASRLLATTNSTPTPEQPLLVIDPNHVIPLQNHTKVEYTASGQVSLKSANEVKEIEKKKDETLSYNQIIVPKGQHTSLQLADGSELHINSGSKVIYPSTFNGNRREIFVDGEIYIDVKRNEKQPFYVKTENFEIRVLGTAFNVYAYSQNSLAEVTLLKGQVQIKDKKGGNLKLDPDQQAQIKDQRLSGKRTVDASSYISWTQGLLQLKGEPLGNLMQKLEHYYGATIICDNDVKELDIHGCLDINCSLSEVLERIAITASIQIEMKDGNYYIHKENS